MWVCGLRGRGRAEQSWEEARLREFHLLWCFLPSLPSWGWSSLPLPCFLALLGSTIYSLNLGNGRKKEGRKAPLGFPRRRGQHRKRPVLASSLPQRPGIGL